MTAASCTNRPIARIGLGVIWRETCDGISYTYPCFLVKPSGGPTTFSSQVNHVCRGVAPPEQLLSVPEETTKLCTTDIVFGSTS